MDLASSAGDTACAAESHIAWEEFTRGAGRVQDNPVGTGRGSSWRERKIASMQNRR
jgi:hypothetical protein